MGQLSFRGQFALEICNLQSSAMLRRERLNCKLEIDKCKLQSEYNWPCHSLSIQQRHALSHDDFFAADLAAAFAGFRFDANLLRRDRQDFRDAAAYRVFV